MDENDWAEANRSSDYKSALHFVSKVKVQNDTKIFCSSHVDTLTHHRCQIRYTDQPDVWNQFVEILRVQEQDAASILHVYHQVTVLLRGAPDLVQEFNTFLPVHIYQQFAAALAEGREWEREPGDYQW